MGRLGVKIIAALMLAWTGWWWIATGGLQSGIQTWLQAQRDVGTQAEVSRMTRQGFPTRIAATVHDMVLSDAQAQATLSVPRVMVSAPIYWPGDVTVELPAMPLTFTTPQGVLTLSFDEAEADIRLHPGSALQLEGIGGRSENLQLDLVEGRVLTIESVQAQVQQSFQPNVYTVDLTAIGVAFGSILQQAFALPASWPATFEPIVTDMVITFDRPWDRSAEFGNRPQPRAIVIEKAQAVYADLALGLTANLTVDANGTPTGTVNISARGWQRMFDMAFARTATQPEWRRTVETVLRAMSDADGALDLNITIENGQMRLGFFPIGPAPLLRIP